MQALKNIFSWNISYADLLSKSGIDRLDIRRDERFNSMAKKFSESGKFAHWFPLRLDRAGVTTRRSEKYKIYKSGTERCLKSPLNLMCRKRNEFDRLNA